MTAQEIDRTILTLERLRQTAWDHGWHLAARKLTTWLDHWCGIRGRTVVVDPLP